MSNLVQDALLAPLFADGAILPANTTANIFGHAVVGQRIRVTLGAQSGTTHADAGGLWCIAIQTGAMGMAVTLMVEADAQTVVSHVRFGTVFLAAGQSNIEFSLALEAHAQDLVQNFTEVDISCYQVAAIDTETAPSYSLPGQALPTWVRLTAQNFGPHSAIAFYAALALAQHKDTGPIGIVECYRGGTSASCWLPEVELQCVPALKAAYLDEYHQAVDGLAPQQFDQQNAAYATTFKAYQQKKAAYMRAHPDLDQNAVKQKVGHTPWPPPMTPTAFFRPAGLYHTEFRKIVPFTFDAVLWYQGENDAPHPQVYDRLLPSLINRWRADLQQPQLPFYVVQLPRYQDEPIDAWPLIRAAQAQTARELPAVHLVSIVDTGDPHNIHPTDKKTPGTRVGAVMAGVNGYDSTPQLRQVAQSHVADDQQRAVTLAFDRTQTLTIHGPLHLEILRQNKWQDVTVEAAVVAGNQLTVTLPLDATAVRYGWANAPVATLFNEVNYPVSPFTTSNFG